MTFGPTLLASPTQKQTISSLTAEHYSRGYALGKQGTPNIIVIEAA
jgi:hypothetical protein